MSARLIAFVPDEATKRMLEEYPSYAEEGPELYDRCTQLAERAPELKDAPEGIYSLHIGRAANNPLVADLWLRHEETGDILLKSSFDMNIIVQSELNDTEEDAGVSRLSRSRDLEGLLAPYIENNDLFNVELLDMLDYIAYPVMMSHAPQYDASDIALGESVPVTHCLKNNKLN